MAEAALRTRSALARIPGVGAMLVLLGIGFAWAAPGFATAGNLSNVLVQSTVLLLLALPMTLIIMAEGLDLSIGAVLTLASVALALVVTHSGSLIAALLASLAVGLVFGLANGALVAVAGLPPFVATLGTLGIAQSLALVLTGGQSVVGIPPSVQMFYAGTVLSVPVPIIIVAAAYAAIHLLLYHTQFGLYIFALGGNREALVFAGVPVQRMLIATYAIGGLMAGIAALLMTARLNAGHPTAGIGMEFDAIAAVAVGGTSFERGDGWLFGTLLGVLAIGVLRNGLNLLAISSSVQLACVGLLVILALLLDRRQGARA